MPDPLDDPFARHRQQGRVLKCPFQGEAVPMILRHADVKAAAADWATFSSDAPFRVPIPSEEDVRSVRQLPIETDPPDHGTWRALVDPFFRRPLKPEMKESIPALVREMLATARETGKVEVVRRFALPLQSRALTHLLAVPEAEAEVWTGWGTHVFRDGADGSRKGAALEAYIHDRLDAAAADPGEDFFSALVTGEVDGRPLTRDEQVGIVNLTFAGGRDTVINTVTGAVAWLADHPADRERLHNEPKLVFSATEELLRILTPLTHIGRVVKEPTGVHGAAVPADGRVSLCWAAANRDPAVFDDPNAVRFDRRPNPHLAFGHGPHTCLGAHHARLILHTLIRQLAEDPVQLTVLEREAKLEQEAVYTRANGYERLLVQFGS